MGQSTSIHSSRYEHPLFVNSSVLDLTASIESADSDDRITVKSQSGSISISSTSLVKFTQNQDQKEFPFLLDLSSSKKINIRLSFMDNELRPDLQLKVWNSDLDAVVQRSLRNDQAAGVTFEICVKESGKYYIAISYGDELLVSWSSYVVVDKCMEMVEESPEIQGFEDHPMELPSDGTQYRRVIVTKERLIVEMISTLKVLIKRAQTLDEQMRNVALARSRFSSYLSNLANLGHGLGNDILVEMVGSLISTLTEQSKRDIEESGRLVQNVTTPLIDLYNSPAFSTFHTRVKLYNKDLAEYHSTVATTSAKPPYSHYELMRFDHFHFLNELVGGLAMRKLLTDLSQYLVAHTTQVKSAAAAKASPTECTINKHIPKIDFLYKNYKENYQSELKGMRDVLVLSFGQREDKQGGKPMFKKDSTNGDARPSSPLAGIPNSGVFYTLGGRGKSGWHKQLIALKDNFFLEYVDYKHPHKLRNEPLDITFACVKSVDTLKDRKYCIEVITPKNVKRLFQVNSEDERDEWVQYLNKAAALKADDNQYNHEKNGVKRLSVVRTAARASQIPAQPDIQALEIGDATPLQLVRDVDPSNVKCCDCGSTVGVEWISLNLLVVVCIKCSGVHRSMGTHISKIRSLELDEKVFASKEMHELLYHVSNRLVNSYLANDTTISPDCSDEERKNYIVKKYVNKDFLQKDVSFNPNDALIKAVHSANIPLVLKALIYGANTSLAVIKAVHGERKEVTLFEYSLTHCHGDPDRPIFDVSQLLIFNNVLHGDDVNPVLDLNRHQLAFWASTIPKKSVVKPQSSRTQPEKQEKAKHKSIKRSHTIMVPSARKGPSPNVAPADTKSKRLSMFKIPHFRPSSSH